MASHESYYTSMNPAASPQLPGSPGGQGAYPPPPPPPKSHDASRTNTPSVPPHPNTIPTQGYASPGPPFPTTQRSMSQPDQGQPGYHYQSAQMFQHLPTQQQAQQPQPPPLPQQNHYAQPSNQDQISLPSLDAGWLPPGVKDHSTADLQPLLHDSEMLDALAKQHPAYAAALEPLKAAVAANLALAQHVSQLEGKVKQSRDQTGQLLLNHTSLQTQWRRKQSELDNALSPWGPRAMYSRLVASINDQELLLRAVHESFVEDGGDGHESHGERGGKATEKEVTEWIKRIREGTTVLEKRREMRQRWDENRVGGWR